MNTVLQKLFSPGHGILAADESFETIEKRFEMHGIPCTPQTRRAWRELLFTTEEIEQYISGIILFDETAQQQTADNVFFPEYLKGRDIIPGIKVDGGKELFDSSAEEFVTKGLDSLRDRLARYKQMGLQFTKWRSVSSIGPSLPTEAAVEENAKRMSEYAALALSCEMTPIIEPEVLMDGAHGIDDSARVTTHVLRRMFSYLSKANVDVSQIILKTNMILPGKDSNSQNSPEEVAQNTLEVFSEVVPHEIGGIVFLSGGQKSTDAIANLREICKKNTAGWRLTFSFSRALQDTPLALWKGKEENKKIAQDSFLSLAKEASSALI